MAIKVTEVQNLNLT